MVADHLLEEMELLQSVASRSTRKLLNGLVTNQNTRSNKPHEYEKIYGILSNVHKTTLSALDRLEYELGIPSKMPAVKQASPQREKKDKSKEELTNIMLDLHELIGDDKLNHMLEQYSDLLVSLVREKMGN